MVVLKSTHLLQVGKRVLRHVAPNWPLCSRSYRVLGPRHRDAVEDLVRREVESCDRLSGLMAVMSVAGGTGSGVGTYLTQCLRDAYPRSFILNHLTWPYGSGEVRHCRVPVGRQPLTRTLTPSLSPGFR